MKILLIEDERPLAIAISRVLASQSWDVRWAPDGHRGLSAAKSESFDAIVLDILLPGISGWDVCDRLRLARVNTPILMLTALDDVDDRVKGLDLGADDYLSKPFDNAELVARLNALMRRERVYKGPLIRAHDLEIDRRSQKVKRNETEITLTRREYDLLEALALNQGRILSRETILARVWNCDESYSNTVDVCIAALRRKVDTPFGTKLIHTAVGFGYVLRTPEE